MKSIFSKRKFIIILLMVIIIDVFIGCFLLINHSFPRLALWNIIESEKYEDFYWAPENKPQNFHFEPSNQRLSIFKDEIFPLINNKDDELKIILAVARYVGEISQYGSKNPVIWGSPEEMLKQIREGAMANCFHLSIVFSSYLSSIDIKSRLWALEGDDVLEKLSHTVSEVYLEDLKKWVLVDVLGSIIYFTKDNLPLSVLELRDELLKKDPGDISVQHILRRNCCKDEIVLQQYTQLLKCVFMRTANDFSNKYDAKIRYGILSVFGKYLDRLPAEWRRGLSYLFGRKDFLLHYVDSFSKSLRMESIVARNLFYFFVISSILVLSILLMISLVIFSSVWLSHE